MEGQRVGRSYAQAGRQTDRETEGTGKKQSKLFASEVELTRPGRWEANVTASNVSNNRQSITVQ